MDKCLCRVLVDTIFDFTWVVMDWLHFLQFFSDHKYETEVIPLGVSAVKYETEGAIDHVDQSDDGANGYSKEHTNGSTCTSEEPTRLRLHKICSTTHWKEPLYNFEEQESSHTKLLEELIVLDIMFLYGCSTPTITLLYQQHQV
ncbi:hypothetical protein GUJ93_ZPchr0008g11916 [Zizania palustris]|uniref:Uncharacterized protein n=1 Tax=Zizania palustris TaxID=103762 RepID=A0A8J5RDD7_ZIZPA|nr:hypothetical protein GUJ93_ZPchr0008g11916 [Zizania palustris]